jgi:peptidoglycan-associated lipoprotein
MFVRTAFFSALLAGLIITAGCGGGNKAVKISPQTVPEPRPIVNTADNPSGAEMRDDTQFDYLSNLELLTVHFDYDSYNLTPEALDILSSNSEALARRPGAVIRVEGHCDERGTEEYNMSLGYKRAQAVREYLVQYGIDPSTVSIISFGESRPVDPSHRETAWRKNRRADFVVLSQ